MVNPGGIDAARSTFRDSCRVNTRQGASHYPYVPTRDFPIADWDRADYATAMNSGNRQTNPAEAPDFTAEKSCRESNRRPQALGATGGYHYTGPASEGRVSSNRSQMTVGVETEDR